MNGCLSFFILLIFLGFLGNFPVLGAIIIIIALIYFISSSMASGRSEYSKPKPKPIPRSKPNVGSRWCHRGRKYFCDYDRRFKCTKCYTESITYK